MPEPFEEQITPEAIIAYGNKSLKDDIPRGYPYIGAWRIPQAHRLEPQSKIWNAWNTPAVNQEGSEVTVTIWLEEDNPYTQTDLLEDEENQIQELIFLIRNSSSIPYRETLANRLITLLKDAKEEDFASVGINVGSLRSFYNFLRLHTTLKYPITSLTPDNTIYASWKGEQKRVFSVHFLPNGDVRFVIFKPNDRHPEKQIRISGTATTDTLIETVTPNGLGDWIAE